MEVFPIDICVNFATFHENAYLSSLLLSFALGLKS